jgi:chromosome segregation ATPase
LTEGLKHETEFLRSEIVRLVEIETNRRDTETSVAEHAKQLQEKLEETVKYCTTLENAHQEISKHRDSAAVNRWNQEKSIQTLNNEVRELKAK